MRIISRFAAPPPAAPARASDSGFAGGILRRLARGSARGSRAALSGAVLAALVLLVPAARPVPAQQTVQIVSPATPNLLYEIWPVEVAEFRDWTVVCFEDAAGVYYCDLRTHILSDGRGYTLTFHGMPEGEDNFRIRLSRSYALPAETRYRLTIGDAWADFRFGAGSHVALLDIETGRRVVADTMRRKSSGTLRLPEGVGDPRDLKVSFTGFTDAWKAFGDRIGGRTAIPVDTAADRPLGPARSPAAVVGFLGCAGSVFAEEMIGECLPFLGQTDFSPEERAATVAMAYYWSPDEVDSTVQPLIEGALALDPSNYRLARMRSIISQDPADAGRLMEILDQPDLVSGKARIRVGRLYESLVLSGFADAVGYPERFCEEALSEDRLSWRGDADSDPFAAYAEMTGQTPESCRALLVPAAATGEATPRPGADLENAALCHAAWPLLPSDTELEAAKPFRPEAEARGMGEATCALMFPPQSKSARDFTPAREDVQKLLEALSRFNAVPDRAPDDALLDAALRLAAAAREKDDAALAEAWAGFEVMLGERPELAAWLSEQGAAITRPDPARLGADLKLMAQILRAHAARNLADPAAGDWHGLLDRATRAIGSADLPALKTLHGEFAALLASLGQEAAFREARASGCTAGDALLCD